MGNGGSSDQRKAAASFVRLLATGRGRRWVRTRHQIKGKKKKEERASTGSIRESEQEDQELG